MARLSWKQLLFAVALGAVFATLQDPPVRAIAKVSSAACRVAPSVTHC